MATNPWCNPAIASSSRDPDGTLRFTVDPALVPKGENSRPFHFVRPSLWRRIAIRLGLGRFA